MQKALTIAAAAAVAGSLLAVPSYAAAQSRYADSCHEQQRRQATTGTIVGGVAGALLGSGVAARGVKTEGAVLGGAVGAVAGHQIAKNNTKCAPPPPRRVATQGAAVQRSSQQRNVYAQPSNCRWVQDQYGGRTHSFEVCRSPDGVWRPSGRS
ncbi:MAG: glycine zipper 2TM domain-containing protein [Phenylobacterium sp.]|uniref:glycine zipper 2TM domain-containing protein n=1 Tax=Phenylobacterium sp. TaxID=1871053 RepID=UPI00391E014D